MICLMFYISPLSLSLPLLYIKIIPFIFKHSYFRISLLLLQTNGIFFSSILLLVYQPYPQARDASFML